MLLSPDSLDPRRWASQLWRLEDVPDSRLFKRLALIVTLLVSRLTQPTSVISRALRRGAQRFWNNDAVDSSLLARRSAQFVLRSLPSSGLVLALHDTMEVDLHGRHCPEDAGPLRSSKSKGYLTHNTFLRSPSDGLLGCLFAQVWTRGWQLHQQDHKQRPPSERESLKWRVGVRRTALALRAFAPNLVVIHLMDREADDYKSFAAARRRGDLVVIRATHDRVISEGTGRLWGHLLSQPAQEHLTLEVAVTANEEARAEARKLGKEALAKFDARVAAHGKTRKAKLQIRYSEVTIHEPEEKRGRVKMGAVYVNEQEVPAELEGVEWMLATTCPVKSFEDAKRVVEWYAARWGIEEFHKVTKHGLNLEGEVVKNVEAFKREYAVVAAVATQMLRWREKQRVAPQEEAKGHVDEEVLRALKEACRFHKLPLPRRAWTVKDVVSRLALLGGYEQRKGAQPGWLVLWRGWGELERFWKTFSFAQARYFAGDF